MSWSASILAAACVVYGIPLLFKIADTKVGWEIYKWIGMLAMVLISIFVFGWHGGLPWQH